MPNRGFTSRNMKLTLVLLIFALHGYSLAAPGWLTEIISLFQPSHTDRISIEPYAACNVQIKDFTFKQPLLLQGSNLWKPAGPKLNVTGKITLACTGGKNVLDGTDDKLAQASCSGSSLRYSGRSSPAANVTCKTSISGDVHTTTEKCADGQGTWSRFGFDLQNGTFIRLYSVCYSQDKANALYSQHRIFGRTVPFKQVEPRRPEFKSAGSAPGVSVASVYKGAAQLETFTRIFGEKQAKEYVDPGKGQMLARGHLSPDADFPLVPLQFATYFYVNVCPQWQSVNAGNWLKVENMVRQLASKRMDDFEVYTGAHDILSLPDENNNYRRVHLADRAKVSVPKWLWKVIYHPWNKEGIALVTLNNPYAQNQPRLLCPNVCEESNWAQSGFANLAKGYTYCCEVNALRNSVPVIPDLMVRRILQF